MKDRVTLGHEADVAETAALTLADNCATERIFAALDWEREEKSRKGQINNAIRRLAKKDRPFARSVLKGKRWEEVSGDRPREAVIKRPFQRFWESNTT